MGTTVRLLLQESTTVSNAMRPKTNYEIGSVRNQIRVGRNWSATYLPGNNKRVYSNFAGRRLSSFRAATYLGSS